MRGMNLNMCILRMLEDIFSLGSAYTYLPSEVECFLLRIPWPTKLLKRRIGVPLIMHIMHVCGMRKKNIYNKVALT